MGMINKPKYIGHPEKLKDRLIECTSDKECWRKNHTPFMGYLAGRNPDNDCLYRAYTKVLERYVRMKQIVFPDEMELFYDLFKHKHIEFMHLRRIREEKFRYSYAGACWGYVYIHGEKGVLPLFGQRDALFSSVEPNTPKPEDRMKVILKSAEKEAIYFCKYGGVKR